MNDQGLSYRLRRLAVEIREFARRPWFDPHARPHWALEGEDVVMQLLVQDIKRGTYIDVGAHMPRRWSTTYGLYRRGWHGLLIEPTPDLARGLRRGRRRDAVEECGVGSEPGSQDFYVFDAPSCSTFDRAQADALLASPRPPRLLQTIPRPIRRLDDIIEQHRALVGRADLIKIDVEGRDLDVLRSVNWVTFRPRVVVVELLGATAESAPATDSAQLLKSHGYDLRAFLFHTAVFLRADS
jgi:FkbM family methyltransferase